MAKVVQKKVRDTTSRITQESVSGKPGSLIGKPGSLIGKPGSLIGKPGGVSGKPGGVSGKPGGHWEGSLAVTGREAWRDSRMT